MEYSAIPFPGGVWYVHDADADKRYQCYYYAPSGPTGIAYSADGLNWTKPQLESPSRFGYNTIRTPTPLSGSSTVWFDAGTGPGNGSYTMGFQPVQLCNLYPKQCNPEFGDCSFSCDLPCATPVLHSCDGINWTVARNASTGEGDASSIWYNVLRRKWILSMKNKRGL